MAVKTNASTALKYPDGMRAGDLKKFQAIASATNQIITLTEDLLILARSEDDCILAIEQINLNLVLAEIVARYQSQIDAKSLTLEVAIQSDILLQGSTNHLDRAIVNLLENAIHYTPVAGKVCILASRIDNQIEIAIVDTGIGIASQDLEKIFDRFWREDSSRTQWVGGSGLGLSIARSIVKQHRGSIEVQSELGKGSKFIVRLPLVR